MDWEQVLVMLVVVVVVGGWVTSRFEGSVGDRSHR